MKKQLFFITILLIICGLFPFSVSFAQNVDRQFVLVEKWTGTWCVYCPGAAMGVEDMMDAGFKVAPISYHQGDNYANTGGSARWNYYRPKYNMNGIPFTVFDGVKEHGGGSANQSLFPNFSKSYNARIAVKSPLFIEFESVKGEDYSHYSCKVKITLKNTSYAPTGEMRLFGAVTESNIKQNWQNQSVINHAERMMLPNDNGIKVEFDDSGVFEQTFNVTVDDKWKIWDLDVVVFVQDMSSYEVLQAYMGKLSDLTADEVANLEAPEVTAIQIPGTQSVKVNWDVANPSDKFTILGYNLYQNGSKLNKSGLLTDKVFITDKQSLGDKKYNVDLVYDVVTVKGSQNVICSVKKVPVPENVTGVFSEDNDIKEIEIKWDAPLGFEDGSGLESNIKGYKVYKGATVINENLISNRSIKDIVTEYGSYVYFVSAVYLSDGIEFESNASVPVTVEAQPVAVNELNKDNILLYPNPVKSGYINIVPKVESYEIFDVTGKKVAYNNVYTDRIDVSELGTGMFFIKCEINGVQFVNKIYVEK